MRELTEKELRSSVTRGVALLDKLDSGWWRDEIGEPTIEGMTGRVDLETLDMGTCSYCVLGQRGGDYSAGLLALGIYGYGMRFHYGFSIECDTSGTAFRTLTELWLSIIESRRFPRRKIARDPWVAKANRTWVRGAAA